MSLILPKGFVVNHPGIVGIIEKISAAPLDLAEIANFWKVYTTTKRRLLDPTAERLENYWWRIWGSQRRELKSAIIAKLFAEISDGQSFVQLRGPANRDEGIPSLGRNACHEPRATTSVTDYRPIQSRPSTTFSSTTSKALVVATPHPILKKTRGPPATQPRPTAHFVLPRGSRAETDTGLQSLSLHDVVQPQSPDTQSSRTDKKAVAARGGKRRGQLVASRAIYKKPVIFRGAQSSTDRTAKVDTENLNQLSAKIPPVVLEVPIIRRKARQELQEKISTGYSSTMSPRNAFNSAGSKYFSVKETVQNGSCESRNKSMPEASAPKQPDSSTRYLIAPQHTITDNPTRDEVELQRTLFERGNTDVKTRHWKSSQHISSESPRVPQKNLSSNHEGPQEQDTDTFHMLADNTLKTASLAPTLIDTTRQLDLVAATSAALPQVTSAKGVVAGDVKRVDMFAKRQVPAAHMPKGTMAVGKGQLTVLLEKDRASTSEHTLKIQGKD
ncbi:hypothetical protein B0J14DRAFT_676819 [Halenospora varia]|nr:hypothetical protein B0J14DRAFT_676819 [Halenospora varia]